MKSYMLTKRPDGAIEFWTDDKELQKRVIENIRDIADAISYRRQITRIYNIPETDSE